jgi:uncharacterized protein
VNLPVAANDQQRMSEAISIEPAPADAVGAPATRQAAWGFWTTAAWGLGTMLASDLAPVAAIYAVLRWRQADGLGFGSFDAALHSGMAVFAGMTFLSLPVTVLMLALAARLARVPVLEYFALKRVGVRTIGFAVACALGYGAVCNVLSYAIGHGLSVPWVQAVYANARASGFLWLVLLTVLVAAPIGEELMFRGFLFRGWAASRLGAPGTILLTSAIWAGMHFQYDWLIRAEIFGMGLMFGYLRLRSGSSIPTMVAHSVYGLAAMIQAMILAG